MDKATRSRIVTQQELVAVAQDMSPRLLIPVGLAMGVPRGRLDQYEAVDAHSPATQIQRLLCDWLAEKGGEASVVSFVTLMRQARVDEDVYKFAFVNRCSVSLTSNEELEQARWV